MKFLLWACLLIVALASVVGCDEGSEAQKASDRMRVVVTSVRPTPDLRLFAADLVRTPDGRIYLQSAPVIKVNRDRQLTVVPVTCYGLARDSRGRVFCSVRSGVAEILPNDRVVLLAGTYIDPSQRMNDREPEIDGRGTEARFHPIHNITSDSKGNIYVETGDLPVVGVRKVRADRQVSTIFKSKQVARGSNNWGWHNFAADSKGNLYFGANGAVIKIDSSGTVGTFAGRQASGPGSSIGEAGVDERFASIHQLRVDTRGNVYVFARNAIRKITPDGKVTTVLQSGCPIADWVQALAIGCTSGLVDGPLEKQIIQIDAFDVDEDGNIYYLDKAANAIRKATVGGVLSTVIRGAFPKHP